MALQTTARRGPLPLPVHEGAGDDAEQAQESEERAALEGDGQGESLFRVSELS